MLRTAMATAFFRPASQHDQLLASGDAGIEQVPAALSWALSNSISASTGWQVIVTSNCPAWTRLPLCTRTLATTPLAAVPIDIVPRAVSIRPGAVNAGRQD